MTVVISSTLVARLLSEAAASPDIEICGLLFGNEDRIDSVQSCANVAVDPACGFEIGPRALIAAHRSARAGGPALCGCYHSHPNGRREPSERDRAGAAGDGSIWAIIADGGMTFWQTRARGEFERIDHRISDRAA
ncbi:MAG: M67 family metallopeptidase [Pseudomonadota bacterium]|nr:M67 family metallopeptidase [Pseudomonadota bacterium]